MNEAITSRPWESDKPKLLVMVIDLVLYLPGKYLFPVFIENRF